MVDIERLVQRYDPNLDRHDPAFQSVAVAFAAFYTGPHVRALVRFTGYLEKTVTDVKNRMRASGLWEKGIVHDEDIWRDAETEPNPCGLALMGLVAQGEFIASRRADGTWLYSVPPPPGGWQMRLPFPDQPNHL
jgi:hypothetical protein